MSNLTRRTANTLMASLPLALKSLASGAKDSGGTMFLALNSVLVSGRVHWPEFAQLASKTGFPGTDVMLEPAMQAGPAATRDLLAQLHLKPAVFDFPADFRKDDATFTAGLPKLKQAAAFAAAIGCPRMVTYIMSSSPIPKDELRATYKKRFTEAARILAEYNVRLGLEFLGPVHIRKAFPHEFIWKMPEMLEFAESCGTNIGLLLDAWHWHHAGGTIDDILSAGKSRIVHIHFDDAPNLPPEQIKDNERLLPGEGVINLTGFLQALQKIGYTDALSVEVFGRPKSETPEEAARKGLEASLAVFKKAGVAQG